MKIKEFSAGSLRRVGGDVKLMAAWVLNVLELPELEEIGEDAWFSELLKLPSLTLPSLRRVGSDLDTNTSPYMKYRPFGGSLNLRSNPMLATVNLSSLESVAGKLDVGHNDQLLALELRSLRDSVVLEVKKNPVLTNLAAPVLSQSKELTIALNRALVEIDLSGLSAAGGYRLGLGDNYSLERFAGGAWCDRGGVDHTACKLYDVP